MRTYFAFAAVLACAAVASAAESALPVAPQPFQSAFTRLDAALEYVGSPLPPQVRQEIQRLTSAPPSPENAAALQAVIDPLCFAHVNINPEARVKVERGAGAATLQQGGWRSFLVKVHVYSDAIHPIPDLGCGMWLAHFGDDMKLEVFEPGVWDQISIDRIRRRYPVSE